MPRTIVHDLDDLTWEGTSGLVELYIKVTEQLPPDGAQGITALACIPLTIDEDLVDTAGYITVDKWMVMELRRKLIRIWSCD